MLVLTRYHGQSIMIGDDVVVTVLNVQGNLVRIGISAPIEIPVHREEVYDKIVADREGFYVDRYR